MLITTAGWNRPPFLLAILATILITLALGVAIGVCWARKRNYTAQYRSLRTERAEVNGHRRSTEQREMGLDRRERELNTRDAAHDDTFRELAGREAMLDQREAAIAEREQAHQLAAGNGVELGAV